MILILRLQLIIIFAISSSVISAQQIQKTDNEISYYKQERIPKPTLDPIKVADSLKNKLIAEGHDFVFRYFRRDLEEYNRNKDNTLDTKVAYLIFSKNHSTFLQKINEYVVYYPEKLLTNESGLPYFLNYFLINEDSIRNQKLERLSVPKHYSIQEPAYSVNMVIEEKAFELNLSQIDFGTYDFGINSNQLVHQEAYLFMLMTDWTLSKLSNPISWKVDQINYYSNEEKNSIVSRLEAYKSYLVKDSINRLFNIEFLIPKNYSGILTLLITENCGKRVGSISNKKIIEFDNQGIAIIQEYELPSIKTAPEKVVISEYPSPERIGRLITETAFDKLPDQGKFLYYDTRLITSIEGKDLEVLCFLYGNKEFMEDNSQVNWDGLNSNAENIYIQRCGSSK